eukprot:2054533-Prymnesium_polylepis.2
MGVAPSRGTASSSSASGRHSSTSPPERNADAMPPNRSSAWVVGRDIVLAKVSATNSSIEGEQTGPTAAELAAVMVEIRGISGS